jgi:Fanconi anemia group M protein
VNLVIFYEAIPSGIRFIQRRGEQGRRTPGRVIILAAEGILDTAYLRASMKRLGRVRSIAEELSNPLGNRKSRIKLLKAIEALEP